MFFQRFLEKKFGKDRNFVKNLKKISKKIGINLEHWERYPTYKKIKSELSNLKLHQFKTLEISSGILERKFSI